MTNAVHHPLFYSRNVFEIRFKQLGLVSLDFPMLDGAVIQKCIEFHGLVGSCAVLILMQDRQTDNQITTENTRKGHQGVLWEIQRVVGIPRTCLSIG